MRTRDGGEHLINTHVTPKPFSIHRSGRKTIFHLEIAEVWAVVTVHGSLLPRSRSKRTRSNEMRSMVPQEIFFGQCLSQGIPKRLGQVVIAPVKAEDLWGVAERHGAKHIWEIRQSQKHWRLPVVRKTRRCVTAQEPARLTRAAASSLHGDDILYDDCNRRWTLLHGAAVFLRFVLSASAQNYV